MGTITKTYSINDATYNKFVEICNSKNLNKSKLIQNSIEKFIFKNSGIKVGDNLLSKVTEEYTKIESIDEDTVSLENGNRLSYSELSYLYEKIDENVLKVKNYIDNKDANIDNVEIIKKYFEKFEFIDIDSNTFKILDNRLKEIYGYDKEILILKIEDNKIERMSINAPSDILSLEEIENLLREFDINPKLVNIKISNYFNKKFDFPEKDLKLLIKNIYNNISPDVLKIYWDKPYINFLYSFDKKSNFLAYKKIIYFNTDKFKIPRGNLIILPEKIAKPNINIDNTGKVMDSHILQGIKDHIYMNVNRDRLNIYFESPNIIFEETSEESYDDIIHSVMKKINFPLPNIEIKRFKEPKEPGIKI